nr:hemin uptake protein HemP [Hyphomicrobium sp. 99]
MSPKKEVAGSTLRQAGCEPISTTTIPDADEPAGSSIRYRVDELLKGSREAILLHRGQEYRLRITATGKLILTK